MIEVRELRYSYPLAGRAAVDGLEFAVERGEIFGFLGPNGAGKSTTQRILIGLLREYEGRVSVLGKPLGDWGADYYERVGVAFEFPNHYLKLTGLENLAYFRSLYRDHTLPPRTLLEQVGLADDGDRPVSQYSKGMKVRLSVARALLNDPEILFLDEPTAGLDPAGGRCIKQLIRQQQRSAAARVRLGTAAPGAGAGQLGRGHVLFHRRPGVAREGRGHAGSPDRHAADHRRVPALEVRHADRFVGRRERVDRRGGLRHGVPRGSAGDPQGRLLPDRAVAMDLRPALLRAVDRPQLRVEPAQLSALRHRAGARAR